MSILATLEDLVDTLRGSHPPTREGINHQTLKVATQYNSSLKQHFEMEEAQEGTEDLSVYGNDHALAQARKEMDRLKADIARLKAQLQES
ncbi:MAG: hypothetical protein HOI23_01145 [Deltaproteobacteria bacterium]|nr:hypothetical protein [Deltaproteobacteria bacterium]